MPTLVLSITRGHARLTLRGELDVASYAALRWRLLDVLALRTALQVDASGVTLIDCVCLSLLDQARRRLGRDGRAFDLVGASLAFGLACALAGHDDLDLAARAAPGPSWSADAEHVRSVSPTRQEPWPAARPRPVRPSGGA